MRTSGLPLSNWQPEKIEAVKYKPNKARSDKSSLRRSTLPGRQALLIAHPPGRRESDPQSGSSGRRSVFTSMRGSFITLEGVDGCGKSTQLAMLARELEGRGYEPVITREPGGTPLGEKIRGLLLSSESVGMAAITELFLMSAARAQHVEQVIKPGKEAGRVVISDRHIDSTVAFQGYGRGLDLAMVGAVNVFATGGLLPDLTI